MLQFIKGFLNRRKQYNELMKLTDRDLHDIGVTRSQVMFDIKRECHRYI
jgi:uncharacterized protein YjiS (DUF1127 family)